MTELSRSLLTAAREGLAPDSEVAARVRARVAAAVGAAAVTTVANSSAAATGSATGSTAAISAVKAGSSATLLKLGAALLALGVVSTVVVVAMPDQVPEAPRVAVMPRDTDNLRNEVRVVASSEPSLAVPHAEHLSVPAHQRKHDAQSLGIATTAPDHAEQAAASEDHATRQPKHATAVDTGEPVSLSREVALIDLAMVSLRKRAPHAALEAIKAYDRETLGRGQMAEDAAAIEIEARCNLDLDATEKLERFDRKWPESAQRERIQTACFAKH